jgi:hypothetical protein
MSMRPHLVDCFLILTAALSSAHAIVAQTALPPANEWAAVEEALGRKGASNPGDVIKFSFPRSDMSVNIAGVQLKPALALGS